jgi:hypothetical protein
MLSLSLYAAAYSAIDLILIYIHPSIRIFSVFFFVSFIVHSVCRDVFDMSDKSYALTIQEQRVTYTIISESNLYACTPQSKIRPHTSIIEYMFLINFCSGSKQGRTHRTRGYSYSSLHCEPHSMDEESIRTKDKRRQESPSKSFLQRFSTSRHHQVGETRQIY